MKKLMLIIAAVSMLAAPTAMAQKVNVDGLKSKMAKCDADIQNEKKAVKAATWYNRGKVYADVIMEPTKALSIFNMDAMMLQAVMGGEPKDIEETANAIIWVYPWANILIRNNKAVAWIQTKEVTADAFDKVVESMNKAYEMDAKGMASKIKNTLDLLISNYSQLGEAASEYPDYKKAVDCYVKAAKLQENPVYNTVDARYYFYAGQMATVLGANDDPSYFAKGQEYLLKAKELGYTGNDGGYYYFLFHCYNGQKNDDPENLMRAKALLLEGIAKYPKDERIIDGLLQLYTVEEGIGDPQELVEIIDKAIAEEPTNADLWFGRGRVFSKLKNYDECIKSFEKIVELKPEDFDANFYLGMFHTAKGDDVNKEFNSRLDTMTSQAEYEAGRKTVEETYAKAIPHLEKALDLNPNSVDCAQYLKELCFRLRNMNGMMDKYNKYNAIYKKLKGIE